MDIVPLLNANSCVVIQNISLVLLNPKLHWSLHMTTPLVSTLSQINPLHNVLYYRRIRRKEQNICSNSP